MEVIGVVKFFRVFEEFFVVIRFIGVVLLWIMDNIGFWKVGDIVGVIIWSGDFDVGGGGNLLVFVFIFGEGNEIFFWWFWDIIVILFFVMKVSKYNLLEKKIGFFCILINV